MPSHAKPPSPSPLEEKKPNLDSAKTVAAIDVGANSMRMEIAEVFNDGRIEVLERLQRAVRLGQNTFRRGRLGAESMSAALQVLRDYRRLLDLYQVQKIRAVATSAVREASNADTFLDRIFMATKLQVEVIDTCEESRLTVSAVRQAVGHALGVDRENALIVDVGGGSTLLTLLQNGEIATSQSLRLGSIRLQEMFSTSEESPERSADLLRQHIANALITLQNSLPLSEIKSFVAVGGDARFAAREIGDQTDSAELVIVHRDAFDKLVERCQRRTPEKLSKKHGIPFADAETLNPALLVYQSLLHKTNAERMIVSHVSMRDGLLLELARNVTGQEDESSLTGIIHSATALARKYRVDLNHARNVAEMSVRLFDFLQEDHALDKRYRLLLRVAGLLHEIGGFVSNRAHHKHSAYLISNSEIFGLNRSEINIVAQIARYHRRSVPRQSHPEYMALSREVRAVVNKLAAILRVADALIRGNYRRPQDVQLQRQGDDLIVGFPGPGSLLLEQRAVSAKGDLFEEVYGLKIHLQEL
ncbi:MAG: Ppx/GppA phosphatase family protein [Thermoguttaceae bacterium]